MILLAAIMAGVVALCGVFWWLGRIHGYDDGYAEGWVDGKNDEWGEL